MLRGKVIALRHESTLLKDNALRDPHVREVLCYLPPGYEESDARYPVVMLLPGFAANHRSMLGYSLWKPNTVEIFDGLISRGACPPAILAMPDCMTCFGGSQFVDSAATGPYQSYLADEIFPFLDRELRTIPKREARAVAGRSSGGFGALRLGMDRPEIVSVLGTHAGDAAFDLSQRPMLTHAAVAIEQAGGWVSFAEKMRDQGPRGGHDFEGLLVLACAAAYAPEGDSFPFCKAPFAAQTAELDVPRWQRWLQHDPLERVGASEDALRQMSLIFIDAGNRDEHGLCFAARRLRDAFERVSAKVHYEEFDGGHRGTSYRYEDSFPVMIGALERE